MNIRIHAMVCSVLLVLGGQAVAQVTERPAGFTAEHIPAVYNQLCNRPIDKMVLVQAMLKTDLTKPGKEKEQMVTSLAEWTGHCINAIQRNLLESSWMTPAEKTIAREAATGFLNETQKFARELVDSSVRKALDDPTRFILPVLDASSAPEVSKAIAIEVGALYARCGKRPDVPRPAATAVEAERAAKEPDQWRDCIREVVKETEQLQHGINQLRGYLEFAGQISRFRCKNPKSGHCIGDADWAKGGEPAIAAQIKVLQGKQADIATLERVNSDWMDAYEAWEKSMDKKFDTFYARNWKPL